MLAAARNLLVTDFPVKGVVAIVWNGRPGEGPHDRRLRETLAAVYEDVGVVEMT